MQSVPFEYEWVVFSVLYGFIQIMGVAAALEAILKTRTAEGSIGWALSLIFMPLVTLPIYLIFGRYKFRGYIKAKRMENHQIQRIAIQQLGSQLESFHADSTQLGNNDAVLETIIGMPFTSSNQIELLINGGRFFTTLFEQIKQAKDYVALSFYIIRNDGVGQQLKKHLLRKASAGITIYVLYDEIGSLPLKKSYIKGLRDVPNIAFVPFNTTKGLRNKLQLNFRNHRKIAIIDGQQALLGGLNIADEYDGYHTKQSGSQNTPAIMAMGQWIAAKLGVAKQLTPWRDTAVLISGPAVAHIQLAFLEDWYWATERIPALNWQIQVSQSGTYHSLVMPTGPADRQENCLLAFLHLIHIAQHSLFVVSPYFVPDRSIIAALHLAALRGVDVKVILPKRADQLLMEWSSQVHLEELMHAGIRFYRYRRGFLHQKVWLIDDQYAAIGSTNLDNRSFRLNFEITLLTKDRTFADEVKNMLKADLNHCQQITLQEVENRPLYKRLISKMAHLLAPIQ